MTISNLNKKIAKTTVACGLLKVSGNDAQSFLQGQLSNDIDKTQHSDWQLNAYCQHQGRIIALLWAIKHQDIFYLSVPLDLQDIVQNRLKMFVLNADVDIANSKTLPDDLPFDLTSASKICGLERYPQVCFASSEKFIPQDLNLDIDEVGVNFSKGCYPGQEVVARVHYLGKPKRRLYQFECDFKVNPLDALTTKQSLRAVGVVVNQVKSNLFATLKVAEENSSIFINEKPIKLIGLATYLK